MFNGLPELFDEKIQNAEVYVQGKLFTQLQILNLLPIVQNEAGMFANYLDGAIEVEGDAAYSNNGIDFNEIKFGHGSVVNGQTLPYGLMYRANTRLEQRGKYNSTLLSFFNSAVGKLADFYEEKYADALIAGGRQSTATLQAWDTAEHIISNEITLIDEMGYDAQGNRTGFTPTDVLINRADKLAIDIALNAENITSNFNYLPSNKVATGDMVLIDRNSPSATIEKYADPNYSIIQKMEDDGVTMEAMNIPPAFLNLKEEDTGRPQTMDYYIWAESNINILDSNGILIV